MLALHYVERDCRIQSHCDGGRGLRRKPGFEGAPRAFTSLASVVSRPSELDDAPRCSRTLPLISLNAAARTDAPSSPPR